MPQPREQARQRRRARADAGTSTLELLLLTPLLLALIFGLVQAGLLWNARHLTNAAAQHGARLARTVVALQPPGSATGSGLAASGSSLFAPAEAGGVGARSADAAVRTSTLAFLRQTGGQALTNPAVHIQRIGDYVTVIVSGTTVGVLPGTTVAVTSRSRTPVEGFRP